MKSLLETLLDFEVNAKKNFYLEQRVSYLDKKNLAKGLRRILQATSSDSKLRKQQ